MKYLVLLIAASASLCAQVPKTSIVGPIYDAFGNPYTGSFVVQSRAKTNTGFAITGTVATVYVTGGVIGNLALVPNDTSTPNLTSYLLTFANKDLWTCIVPTSAIPIPFTQACAPSSTPPNQAIPVTVSQIIPSSINGSVVTTQEGITVWAPPPGEGITWYSQAVNGGTASQNIVVSAASVAPSGIIDLQNVIVLCDGIGECGSVTTSQFAITVTSLTPWTGTLWIGTGRFYSLKFTSATSASVILPLHGLNAETLAACYDATGHQFGAGALTSTLHDTGIGGAQGPDFTIDLGTAPVSGHCTLIGN